MDDKSFEDLKLRMTIVPHQVRWPAEHLHWQRLHQVVNEARERMSEAYMQMDEIDRNPDLSREGKERQRRKAAAQAVADFEASKTLARAREAVEFAVAKHNIEPKARDGTLKAMKESWHLIGGVKADATLASYRYIMLTPRHHFLATASLCVPFVTPEEHGAPRDVTLKSVKGRR